MAQSARVIDPELWALISKAATKRRKKPQNFLKEIVLDYIEREEDLAWWKSIQREYRGRELSEADSAAFVKKYRREKHAASSTRKKT